MSAKALIHTGFTVQNRKQKQRHRRIHLQGYSALPAIRDLLAGLVIDNTRAERGGPRPDTSGSGQLPSHRVAVEPGLRPCPSCRDVQELGTGRRRVAAKAEACFQAHNLPVCMANLQPMEDVMHYPLNTFGQFLNDQYPDMQPDAVELSFRDPATIERCMPLPT
jgi:hypothetical protein